MPPSNSMILPIFVEVLGRLLELLPALGRDLDQADVREHLLPPSFSVARLASRVAQLKTSLPRARGRPHPQKFLICTPRSTEMAPGRGARRRARRIAVSPIRSRADATMRQMARPKSQRMSRRPRPARPGCLPPAASSRCSEAWPRSWSRAAAGIARRRRRPRWPGPRRSRSRSRSPRAPRGQDRRDRRRRLRPRGRPVRERQRRRLATDGNPATAWKSERYRSTFRKSGVGLVVDAGRPRQGVARRRHDRDAGLRGPVRVGNSPTGPFIAVSGSKNRATHGLRPEAPERPLPDALDHLDAACRRGRRERDRRHGRRLTVSLAGAIAVAVGLFIGLPALILLAAPPARSAGSSRRSCCRSPSSPCSSGSAGSGAGRTTAPTAVLTRCGDERCVAILVVLVAAN